MKILIIKISSMGDIIHTLPAITDISETISNISLDWIVEETFSEIPKWHPAINQVIPVKFRNWKKKWYKLFTWKQFYDYINPLKKNKYDIIIDAQGLLKTSLLITSIAKGKKHGMDYKSAREPLSSWFYNKCHYINKNQHAINRIRQLFSYSLKYPIPNSIAKYNIQHLFKQNKPKTYNKKPYIIFLHTTTQLNKHWPEHNWHTLIQYVTDMNYYVKIPFWTKTEENRTKRLAQFYDKVIILPKLTLKKIATQMIQATAIVSVDTGLSHLAAALECPNITLYGPTNPQLIGTYGKNQTILRSPTKMMKHLTPTDVQKKLHTILNTHPYHISK